MSARLVRAIVVGVCAAGVAGMIVTSVLGHNGAALTFGLITAVAVLCMMVATAVTEPAVAARTTGGLAQAGRRPVQVETHPSDVEAEIEAQAEQVEVAIGALVAAGAAEDDLRSLVRSAIGLGRLTSRSAS